MEMILQAFKTKGIIKVAVINIAAYGISLASINEGLKTVSLVLAISFTLYQFYKTGKK